MESCEQNEVVAVVRRRRGRPPGSRNRQKSPATIARDSPAGFRSLVLEVSPGNDVVEAVSAYARRRGRGVCVLCGSGTVANVTLRQPSGSAVTMRGSFDIASVSGTMFPPPAPSAACGLSIFLSMGHGQVVGGIVVAPLVASGPVFLISASFSNAVFERLPLEESDSQTSSVSMISAAAPAAGPFCEHPPFPADFPFETRFP